MKKFFNLQYFATQTTLLDALSDEMKTFYEDTLIDLAEPKLVHNQFGDKYDIPKNGGKTIEFRKYEALPKATTPITEGVTPVGNNLEVNVITAEVHQYGDYIVLSDLLILTAIDNNVVQSTKLLGAQAGKTLDSVTRDIINGGTNVIFAGDRAGRSSLTVDDTLSVDLIRQASTLLAAYDAVPVEGSDSYVSIIHPYTRYDLISSDEWIDIHKYADPEAIFAGEIGMLDNVRFVMSTEAKIWKDSSCPNNIVLTYKSNKTYADVYIDGTAATSDNDVKAAIADGKTLTGASGADIKTVVTYTGGALAVFSTLVIAANAYGVTAITGGGLQHIVKQLGYGDDPLNQRSSVGWKATATAERLVEVYMVRIESCSKYSTKAKAN